MKTAAQIKPSVIEESSVPPPPNEQASIDANAEAAKQISDKLGRLAAIDDELAQVIKNVKIKITPEGVLIETVDEDKGLLFDLSSAKLTPAMQRFLRAFAPMIVKVGRPVEINGHTDARKFAHGSKLNNWDLSYERAAAAREILEDSGVPGSQVIGLYARASTQLYDPKNPLSSQNRRLSFLLRVTGPGEKAVRADELDAALANPDVTPTPVAKPADTPPAEPAK
jgi:chemotaxis protein MotB